MNKFDNLGDTLAEVDWQKKSLKTFKKNFLQEHPDVKARTDDDVKKILSELKITVKGTNVPRPVVTFEEAKFPKYIMETLQQQENFVKPSAIQSQGWPVALSGRDMVGIAETGSGKTLSFLLPGIVHVNAQEMLESGDGPIVLVMAPTRELVMQIEQQCRKFAQPCKISCLAIFGGVPRDGQQQKLSRGVEILIATPGRLLDFMESGVVKLNRVTYLVLDEADRMLDMGFEKHIKKILGNVRPDRQTLMWSATWPKEVEELARSYCNVLPVHIQIGNPGLTANLRIKQVIDVCEEEDKYYRFMNFMKKMNDGSKVIVFCETKRGVDDLSRKMRTDGWHAVKGIHGDKSQAERDSTYKDFKDGTCYILIATDVASRGLDVKDIKYVVNYDMPKQCEDYVHRIGRTARAGASGSAYALFTKNNMMIAGDLVKLLKLSGQEIPSQLYDYAEMAKKARDNKNNMYRKWRKVEPNEGSNNSYSHERSYDSSYDRESSYNMAIDEDSMVEEKKETMRSRNAVSEVQHSSSLGGRDSQREKDNLEQTLQPPTPNPSTASSNVLQTTSEFTHSQKDLEKLKKTFQNYFDTPDAAPRTNDSIQATESRDSAVVESVSIQGTQVQSSLATESVTSSASSESTTANPVYAKKWGKK
eukprot:403350942